MSLSYPNKKRTRGPYISVSQPLVYDEETEVCGYKGLAFYMGYRHDNARQISNNKYNGFPKPIRGEKNRKVWFKSEVSLWFEEYLKTRGTKCSIQKTIPGLNTKGLTEKSPLDFKKTAALLPHLKLEPRAPALTLEELWRRKSLLSTTCKNSLDSFLTAGPSGVDSSQSSA